MQYDDIWKKFVCKNERRMLSHAYQVKIGPLVQHVYSGINNSLINTYRTILSQNSFFYICLKCIEYIFYDYMYKNFYINAKDVIITNIMLNER